MNQEFKNRFSKQLDLDVSSQKVLDSIRFQDGDLSIKTGANLAFTGLIIATAIVQLSTGKGTIIYLDHTNYTGVAFNTIGLLILFGSACTSLFTLTSTPKYSNESLRAIIEFDNYVQRKRDRVKCAILLTVTGTGLTLGVLMFNLLARL